MHNNYKVYSYIESDTAYFNTNAYYNESIL